MYILSSASVVPVLSFDPEAFGLVTLAALLLSLVGDTLGLFVKLDTDMLRGPRVFACPTVSKYKLNWMTHWVIKKCNANYITLRK